VLHKATLRYADEPEIGAIEAFIDEVKEKDPEGGKHLLSRPPAEYRHAVENRLLYVCVVQSKIAALSGAFFVPFKVVSRADPTTWSSEALRCTQIGGASVYRSSSAACVLRWLRSRSRTWCLGPRSIRLTSAREGA